MTVTAMPAQDATGGEEAPAGAGRRKKLVLVVVLVALAAAAAWYFLLRPAPAPSAPLPGEVVPLEPIQVNLADGHYLKIAIALQAVEGAHEIDGSKALDATIETFSNRPLSSVLSSRNREKLRAELTKEVEHLYEEEVMDVYLTEFVTQ
jgi:flagellar FliL protein